MAECLPLEANEKTKTSGGGKIRTKIPQVTRVVCVKKQSLNKQGYRDLKHWLTNPNNVYIGRNMTFYVPGAEGSKWKNPFPVKKYGRDKCIEMYKEYIQTDKKKYDGKTLLESLEELRGKTLGCWCSPDPCHGDAIIQLLTQSTKSIKELNNDKLQGK